MWVVKKTEKWFGDLYLDRESVHGLTGYQHKALKFDNEHAAKIHAKMIDGRVVRISRSEECPTCGASLGDQP